MEMGLVGKWVLVIGLIKGIGWVIVVVFVKEGVDVVINGCCVDMVVVVVDEFVVVYLIIYLVVVLYDISDL